MIRLLEMLTIQAHFFFDSAAALGDERHRLVDVDNSGDEELGPPERVFANREGPISARWDHLPARDARKRVKRFETRQESGSVKGVTQKRRSEGTVLQTKVISETSPVTSSGWMGLRRDAPTGGISLAELLARGLRLFEWDGRTTHPLLDSVGRQIGVLLGRPRGDTWDIKISAAADELRGAQAELGQQRNKRGDYAFVNSGISFGGGQMKPGNLRSPTVVHGAVVDRLLCSRAFQDIAGYGSEMLRAYAPRLYNYYEQTLEALINQHPVQRNFASSVFAACTFNLGPATVTRPHIDSKNLAWGWCSITALGCFNPDIGGHLVLWDLGLVIRFPPGSTIFIQSAILTHSNVPVVEGDERFSFTQFSAAGLFRWVENGFMSDKDLLKRASASGRADFRGSKSTRWEEGLRMLERIDVD
ncbi:hypothetical protein DXG01_016915 [Tephrocybe rancida]|nr:hypothetical protein DXG01_016915 [Tephrocybe rancida]